MEKHTTDKVRRGLSTENIGEGHARKCNHRDQNNQSNPGDISAAGKLAVGIIIAIEDLASLFVTFNGYSVQNLCVDGTFKSLAFLCTTLGVIIPK